MALITLVFPTSENNPGISAVQESIISDLAAAQLVSRTPSVLSSTFRETSITLSVPYNNLEEVLRKTQNFPQPEAEHSWTLKNAGKCNSGPKLRLWLIDVFASFVGLIKVCMLHIRLERNMSVCRPPTKSACANYRYHHHVVGILGDAPHFPITLYVNAPARVPFLVGLFSAPLWFLLLVLRTKGHY